VIDRDVRRRRVFLLISLCITILLGLTSRRWPIGWSVYDKSLGDALYAVMVYLVIALLAPRTRTITCAIVAVAICLAIELFKLTGLPNAWRASAISRLVFGTTFSVHNLICYTLGISFIAIGDSFARREPHSGQREGDARRS
jgi:hypothetical protein